MIMVLAGSPAEAAGWAREQQLPKQDWRYVREAWQLRGVAPGTQYVICDRYSDYDSGHLLRLVREYEDRGLMRYYQRKVRDVG